LRADGGGFNTAWRTSPFRRRILPFELTRLAAFGFILEIFFMVELLFAGGEDKIRRTVHTFQYPVLKFWHGTILRKGSGALAIRTAVKS
jgi:hypothetical protein